DRKSTRLNSSHVEISYAVFCLKKKKHRRGGALAILGVTLSGKTAVHLNFTFGEDHVRHASCFFFNDTAPPEIYPLSLHDALPILLLAVTIPIAGSVPHDRLVPGMIVTRR